MPNEIKYGGVTIAKPIGGRTATLPCSGKKMSGDISIDFELVVPIKVIVDGSSLILLDAAIFEEDSDTISIGGTICQT